MFYRLTILLELRCFVILFSTKKNEANNKSVQHFFAILPLFYVTMKSFCRHQYNFTAAKFRVGSSQILIRGLLRFW